MNPGLQISARLSPRRRYNADRFFSWLNFDRDGRASMSLAAYAELAEYKLGPVALELAMSDLFAIGAIDLTIDEHGADVVSIPGDQPSVETRARRMAAEFDRQTYRQCLDSLQQKTKREGGQR